MNPTIDREWLFSAFINGLNVTINGIEGYIQSIEREDGSGKKFNVMFTSGKKTFVRTN